MRSFKLLATAIAAAALLASCGGGSGSSGGDQSPAVKYSAVVNFGDSLSDAGTYGPGLRNAGIISDSTKGGQFTVNGIAGAVGADPVPTYTFAQLVSAAAIGKVSCAARTGGFQTPPVAVSGCTNYAQGGARVAFNNGPGNAGTGEAGNINGALTEPVVTQIANYATASGSANFTGTELITVLAGPNDLFIQLNILRAQAAVEGGNALVVSLVTQLVGRAPDANKAAAQSFITTAAATAAAAAGATPTSIISAAVTAAATHAVINGYTTTAVADAATIGATAGAAATLAGQTYAAGTGATIAGAAMVAAANTLATAVKGMVTRGAKYVVVVNIPDVSQTPDTLATIVKNSSGVVTDNSGQRLVLGLVNAFNSTIKTALESSPGVTTPSVLLVDAFSENLRQFADPAHFALTNVTTPACNLRAPTNPFGSSLLCNPSNLITGAGDTSHYLFADGVHPTPFGHKLLAQYVARSMTLAGWL